MVAVAEVVFILISLILSLAMSLKWLDKRLWSGAGAP
jgi:hypothetical protein